MYLFGKTGPNGFGYRTTAEQVTEGIDASGVTAIVTGATSGIGEETTRMLALRGATVYIAARSEESGRKTKESIQKEIPNARLEILAPINLSSQSSIRQAAEKFLALNQPLNLLINNAGIMFTPFGLTEEDIELQFGTNYIGHFLLTKLLLKKLKDTANETGIESRIVMLSSSAMMSVPKTGIDWDKINDQQGYNTMTAYGVSKMANAYFAQELTRRLQEEGVTNVTINAVHPGAIKTNLARYKKKYLLVAMYAVSFPLWKSIPQGAATTCYVALNPALEGVSGKFFCDCDEYDITNFHSKGNDEAECKKLWELSLEYTSR